MNIGPINALLPVERAGLPTLSTREEDRNGFPPERSKSRMEFMFLGYGPPSGQWLYDEAGRHVSSRGLPGSMVDLYA